MSHPEDRILQLNRPGGASLLGITAGIKVGQTYYVAYKRSGLFHVVEASLYQHQDHGGEWFLLPQTSVEADFYQPIAPGTTLADVDGATHAYDDGTYWHFAHSTPGEHHDLEALVEALLIAHFQPRVNRAVQAVAIAGDTTTRTLANNYLDALNGLLESVLDHAEKTVRALTLGEHRRESPEKDNNRAVAVASVRAALAATRTAAADNPVLRYQVPALEAACTAVVTELTATPTIETRTQRAARLAAEAKAKAAAEASGD